MRARYAFLTAEHQNILSILDIGQLSLLGNIACRLSPTSFGLLYPFSFADMYLENYPHLSDLFNALSFSMQCRILDVAMLFARKGSCQALVGIDYETGTSGILALAKNRKQLFEHALSYLADPLLSTMVDEQSEHNLSMMLAKARHALGMNELETQSFCVLEVPCSEEFFITWVGQFLLDAPYRLHWGKEKDDWGRNKPVYLTGADDISPE